MPTLVELDQLLDIALTTPEIGTVNFNILRALLHEILRHLNIETKLIDIDNLRSDLKSAGDFIKDGYVEILNREIRSDGTPGTAESSLKATVDAEPEETIIGEKDNEGRSKSETQTIVVEESETQASERSPVPQDSPVAPLKPSSGLSVSPDSPTASLKPASGLSVKDHPPPASRSSVMLVRRSDSFRNLKKIISELQERVEVLESQPAPTADPVRSAASLVRKESKTPAHDFVELINIKRKLEASENSLEGLSDMVDALTADVNTLKDLLPSLSNQVPSKVTSEIEALKNSFKAFQDGEVSNMSAKNEKLESMLANLMDAMDEIKNKPSTKDEGPVSNEISEALQQKLETLEKQLEGVTAQIQVIEEKIEGTDERFCGAEQASNDTILQVKSLVVGVGDLNDKLAGLDDKLAGLDRGLKNHKTLIEDNEMQIHQLKNTITLLQRESLQRANEEVEKIKAVAEESVENPVPRHRTSSQDRDELSLIRTMIFDLQEEKDKLKQMDVRLSDELYRKQKHLDDLHNLIDELRDVKADKELLSMGFELKADKRDVDCKIGREDFEHYMSLVDQSLRDLLQRLEGHENALTRALEGLTSDVSKKLNKEDVEPLKHYLEARMETMRPKPVEKPPPDEFAAGIRKQFLVNHNCISCDRPVKYAREETFPPLPAMHSMPGSKSNRPYTTFEIEQIRQHMLQGGSATSKERFAMLEKQRNKLQKEILRLSGVSDLHELAEVTARACGGIHTLTYPHSQAIVRGLQLNREELDFLVPQKDFQAVDILGQDGHIYKGLLDRLSPTLPQIPQKSKSPGMSNPQRNLGRSTTPASANAQKVADEVDN